MKAGTLPPSPVRNLYNATANKFDPRRYRRQMRVLSRSIQREHGRDPISELKYQFALYATTRGVLIKGAAAAARRSVGAV
jgi:hypothetical protein